MTAEAEDFNMPRRFITLIVASAVVLMCSSGVTLAQTWNSPGLPRNASSSSIDARLRARQREPRDWGNWAKAFRMPRALVRVGE